MIVSVTASSRNLCSSIPALRKAHYTQNGVGHYGVFNGSRFRAEIMPRISDFVANVNQRPQTVGYSNARAPEPVADQPPNLKSLLGLGHLRINYLANSAGVQFNRLCRIARRSAPTIDQNSLVKISSRRLGWFVDQLRPVSGSPTTLTRKIGGGDIEKRANNGLAPGTVVGHSEPPHAPQVPPVLSPVSRDAQG